jgi:superkiller protein 3
MQAQALCPDDWMCAYLIGKVQQQMGHFEDAIAAFELILEKLPSEVGVRLSLGEAYLSMGRKELSENFQTRAEHSLVSCIRVCLQTIQGSPGFRSLLWKTMADAVFSLSARRMFGDEENVRSVLATVTSLLPAQSDHLSALMLPPSLNDENTLNGIKIIEIAVAAYSYRLSLCSSESVASKGSAWFDLGVSLQSWTAKSPTGQSVERARVKAVSCFNQALREDPGNVVHWVAIGDVHFLSHAKVAQHAYVKALEIESKVYVVVTCIKALCIVSDQFKRMLSHGQILGCSISITMMSSLQMKFYIVRKLWILTTLLLGLARHLLLPPTTITRRPMQCLNMPSS